MSWYCSILSQLVALQSLRSQNILFRRRVAPWPRRPLVLLGPVTRVMSRDRRAGEGGQQRLRSRSAPSQIVRCQPCRLGGGGVLVAVVPDVRKASPPRRHQPVAAGSVRSRRRRARVAVGTTTLRDSHRNRDGSGSRLASTRITRRGVGFGPARGASPA